MADCFDVFDTADLRNLFRLVRWCLHEYFSVPVDQAETAILSCYNELREKRGDESYLYDGAFCTATYIYYFKIMQGDMRHFTVWRKIEGFTDPPRSYFEMLDSLDPNHH